MSQQIKIAKACINPPGKDTGQNYNNEWVELQVEASVDLGGCELQHYINPDTEQREWATYYRFSQDETFNRGDRIRVHSGSGKAKKDDDGMYHRHVADNEEKGRWWLNNTGDEIRLIDTNNTLIDRKAFTGEEGHCGGQGQGEQTKPQTQYA